MITAREKMFLNISKKIAAGLTIFLTLVCILHFQHFQTKITEAATVVDGGGAFVPTFDAPNYAKNTITAINTTSIEKKETWLDRIVTTGSKVMLQSVTNSVVTWINSGFQGSPAFLTDPESFFVDVADQTAGDYIANEFDKLPNGEPRWDFLCRPFDIRFALNASYSYGSTRTNYCRLSTIVNNVDGFAKFTANGDFGQGGWDSWFEMTQNPSSNPLGLYIGAKIEMDEKVARALRLQTDQLSWGQGFLSWRGPCKVPAAPKYDAQGKVTNKDECKEPGDIKTPGSVIESQLNNTLGSGQRQLEVADEINEIVGALVGQLVKTVFEQGLTSFGRDENNDELLFTPLAVTCSPNKTLVSVDEEVIWTASVFGGYGDPEDTEYIWSGDERLSGNTATITTKYVTQGTKKASVTVSRAGETVTEDCLADVSVPEGPILPPLAILCRPDKARANINDTVTWTAELVGTAGNAGDTTFVWSGSSPIAGSITSSEPISAVYVAYTNQGRKTATVAATRNGQTVSGQCIESVEINPPLEVSCSPNVRSTRVNQLVTWAAEVRGGEPGQFTPTYLWTGSDPISTSNGRTSQRTSVFYSNIGTKTANVLVTRGSQSEIKSCSPDVTVSPPL